MEEKYTKLQAIKSIIGKFNSIGETNEDEVRYDNLLDLEPIIYELIREVIYESNKVKNYQYSMKKSGKKALEIIREIFYLVHDVVVETNERGNDE